MTNDDIRNLEANSTLWDKGDKGSVTGLHVRSSATGTKSFYLFYRTNSGQQRRPRVGKFGSITITQARSIAREWLEEIARGGDPQGEKRALSSEPTLGEVYALTLEKLWSLPRYVKSKRKADVESHWKVRIEKTFGKQKLSTIKPLKLRAWMDTLADHPTAANRALEVISRVFSFAEENEIVPMGTNPCRAVRAFPETKRKRFASIEEIGKLNDQLTAREWQRPYGVAFIRVMLQTGSRPTALERMTWDQIKITVDGDTGERHGLYTFFGKGTADSGEAEETHLTEDVLQLLEKLPKRPDGLVLGKNPVKLWRSIRVAIGCDDLWLRDLRRTYATLAKRAGVKQETIGDLLNQKSIETTKRYAMAMQDVQKEASLMVAKQIKTINSNVVPFKKA